MPRPVTEFAFPGPLRDELVAAVLDGTKTATTGLLQDYELDGEPLPVVGARSAVVVSAGECRPRPCCCSHDATFVH